MTEPRSDFIDWDEFFMLSACVASNRSKDPSRQVGAVVVKYNGRRNFSIEL